MPAHKRGSSVLRSVAAAVAQQKAAPKQTSAQHQPASGGVQKRKQQQTPSPKQKQQKQQHKQQRKQAGQGAGRAHGQAGPGPSSTRHAGGHPCINVIHRQAAFAVQRLLTADETRSKGASLKSLTLAPHIQHKRATYAVTCQVLQCELCCGYLQSSQGCLPPAFVTDADSAQRMTNKLMMSSGLTRHPAFADLRRVEGVAMTCGWLPSMASGPAEGVGSMGLVTERCSFLLVLPLVAACCWVPLSVAARCCLQTCRC